MSAAITLLADAFGRIRDAVDRAVSDLTEDQLTFRVDEGSNSIAWLVWHLTRVQDSHVSELNKAEQIWTADGWADRFALPFSPDATGYGHKAEDVAAVRGVAADQLAAYHDAVCRGTLDYLRGLEAHDLASVVDTSWDPPVTRGIRLVSVIADDLQHAGQALFVRGIVERR